MKPNSQIRFNLKTLQRLSPALIIPVIVFLFTAFAGCNAPATVSNTLGRITMTSQYSPSNVFCSKVPKNGITRTTAIDSLRITRARFVLRDIKYKTKSDSSNFCTAPIVLELNLSSVIQNISLSDVSFGSYDKIEFDVYRIELGDVISLPSSERVQFRDFEAGERYSIIISGKMYVGMQSIVFTFRSRISAKQMINLSPEFVISDPSQAFNATMIISSEGWFRSSSGDLLDPSDVLNENTISDNLCASINVIRSNTTDDSKDAE